MPSGGSSKATDSERPCRSSLRYPVSDPRPLLMIATIGYDMIHPIEQVLEAYEKAREPKRLALLPYDQTGLYEDPGLAEAMAEAIAWFHKYL